VSPTPEQGLRQYRSALLASMEKPEPRRTFEGWKRARELESVIPSKAQALATLNEKVSSLQESLKKLHEIRDGIILDADRASLQSVFTDINIAEHQLQAREKQQRDQVAELAGMQEELRALVQEQAAVDEFNRVSDFLDEAKRAVSAAVETICKELRHLRDISMRASYSDEWNSLSPSNRTRLRNTTQSAGFQDLVKFFELQLFEGIARTTTPERGRTSDG
jgi:hypothetical protein